MPSLGRQQTQLGNNVSSDATTPKDFHKKIIYLWSFFFHILKQNFHTQVKSRTELRYCVINYHTIYCSLGSVVTNFQFFYFLAVVTAFQLVTTRYRFPEHVEDHTLIQGSHATSYLLATPNGHTYISLVLITTTNQKTSEN